MTRRGSGPATAVRRFVGALDLLVQILGYAAGGLALAVSLFITSEIITRRFFGFSSRVTDEIGGYALALMASWSLAFALKSRAHVRIDVLIQYFPPKLRAYADWLAYLVLLGVLLITVWQLWEGVVLQYELGARHPSILQIDLYIPQAGWAFGYVVFAVLALVHFIGLTAGLVTGRVTESPSDVRVKSVDEEVEETLDDVEARVGN